MSSAALAAAGMLSADAAGQEQRPYPTKNERSASAPGPGNPPLDAQNPDSFLPPPTDAGGVQTFKYPFALSHKRMQEGGWSREVTVRETRADLTPTEWGLLVALATVPGRVYSRYELINRVRGYEFEGYERTVDSHVKNLRRKIEEDPGSPRIVQTVIGGGYRLGLARDD